MSAPVASRPRALAAAGHEVVVTGSGIVEESIAEGVAVNAGLPPAAALGRRPRPDADAGC